MTQEPAITYSDRPKPTLLDKPLAIGCLIYEGLDQIDFTGPFEVLSRIPDSTLSVIAATKQPIRDINGLILTPEMTIAEAPPLDVLLVPGGIGQQAFMEDTEILSFIKAQSESGRLVFSVCTGALLCGAAGHPARASFDDALGRLGAAALLRGHPNKGAGGGGRQLHQRRRSDRRA